MHIRTLQKKDGEHKKVPHFQENRERHLLGNAILAEQHKQQPQENRGKKIGNKKVAPTTTIREKNPIYYSQQTIACDFSRR